MKRIKSYEINQPKGSNAEVIGINYESDRTMYICELLRAMANARQDEKITRRQFSILVVIAERGDRVTNANVIRSMIGFRAKSYIDDLDVLVEKGLLVYTRENRNIIIRLTLSCYEWLSKVLPSFKFVRPKHLIFD